MYIYVKRWRLYPSEDVRIPRKFLISIKILMCMCCCRFGCTIARASKCRASRSIRAMARPAGIEPCTVRSDVKLFNPRPVQKPRNLSSASHLSSKGCRFVSCSIFIISAEVLDVYRIRKLHLSLRMMTMGTDEECQESSRDAFYLSLWSLLIFHRTLTGRSTQPSRVTVLESSRKS